MNCEFNLCPKLLVEQLRYLTSNIGLYNLFDKLEVNPPFIIPEHSLVIDLTNITFGPNKYTVVIPQNNHKSFRIIYYSLLYFIFDKNIEKESVKMYQNLLTFIFRNDLSLSDTELNISDDEAKTYLLKFLHILQKARCKHKITVVQLSNLPHIDILFIHLIKTITKQSDLVIQRNGSIIHSKIKQYLGFDLQFLNNQTLVFQREFLVDIREFNQSCQFYIRQQNSETIKKIKQDILLQESAHFMMQQRGQLCGDLQMSRKNARKIKMTKKSTIKSIELKDQQQLQQSQLQNSQKKANPESNIIIKSFLDMITFTDKKETFNAQKPRIGFGIKRFQFQNQCKNSFGFNFSESLSTIRQKNREKQNSILKNKSKIFNKTATNVYLLGKSYNDSYMSKRTISPSYSMKCFKNDGLLNGKKENKIRIPSFIVNRARQRRQFQEKISQKQVELIRPKITFVYKNK